MPGSDAIQTSGFWRVPGAGAQVLALGDGAVLPLLVAGALLVAAGLALTLWGRPTALAAATVPSQLALVGLGLGFVLLLRAAVAVLFVRLLILVVAAVPDP